MQPLLHLQELADLALKELGDRDAGPLAHDVGDVLRGHLLGDHLVPLLQLGQLRLAGRDLFLELHERAVLELGGLGEVGGALGRLDLGAHRFEPRLLLTDLRERGLLLVPVGTHALARFLEVGELLLQFGKTLLARGVGLFLERLALDLEPADGPLDLVQFHWHRVDLHAELRSGFVHEVDRLVRQEPVVDVPGREDGRGDKRAVEDPHTVVDLVALAKASEDRDRVLDRRLAHVHGLKAPLEGSVLLDVLAVLVERGRADRVQLAAREHRLQEVRGVQRALCRARTNDGVQLVDEQDDLALARGDLLEDGLEAFLELTAVLGAREQRADVEPEHALVLEPLRHVAADDPLRETFDDRRLADAGLADQHRVVLRASREDLDDAADLLIAPDNRIHLVLAGHLGEVAAVLLEHLVLVLGILVGDPLIAPDVPQRLQHAFVCRAGALQRLTGVALVLRHREKQVLR